MKKIGNHAMTPATGGATVVEVAQPPGSCDELAVEHRSTDEALGHRYRLGDGCLVRANLDAAHDGVLRDDALSSRSLTSTSPN